MPRRITQHKIRPMTQIFASQKLLLGWERYMKCERGKNL